MMAIYSVIKTGWCAFCKDPCKRRKWKPNKILTIYDILRRGREAEDLRA